MLKTHFETKPHSVILQLASGENPPTTKQPCLAIKEKIVDIISSLHIFLILLYLLTLTDGEGPIASRRIPYPLLGNRQGFLRQSGIHVAEAPALTCNQVQNGHPGCQQGGPCKEQSSVISGYDQLYFNPLIFIPLCKDSDMWLDSLLSHFKTTDKLCKKYLHYTEGWPGSG